jgi:uncharacterized protein (TIGR02246 family)
MTRITAIATMTVGLFAQGGPAGDEAAVKNVVDHWRQAWERFDGSALQGDYTEDADWLNAFGIRKKGSAEIVAFVSEVVRRPGVQGRHTPWGEIHVRFVRPDVALAYRDYQTLGHKMLDGKELPERRTHATWTLIKDGGKWRIASHVISDEQQ